MRSLYLTLVTFLLMSFSYGGTVLKDSIKEGKAIVCGYLDTSTIPYRLYMNHKLQNQEMIFVTNLKSEDAFLYNEVEVTLNGKASTYKGSQYMIEVESIRRATKSEMDDLKESKLPSKM